MSFYTIEELGSLGLARFGENVLISRKASIYNPERISIGNHVRIDDFCVLSAGEGGIQIGSYIHIAVYSLIIGAGLVTLSDFCNLSSRVSIYSSNDDYTGKYLTNPMLPVEFTGVTHDDVFVGKHVIIGSGSVILPGVRLGEGVAIGALSLVTDICESFWIYAGIPVKKIRQRSCNLLVLEDNFHKRNIDRFDVN